MDREDDKFHLAIRELLLAYNHLLEAGKQLSSDYTLSGENIRIIGEIHKLIGKTKGGSNVI